MKTLTNRVAESQINLDFAVLEKLYASDFIEVSGLGTTSTREKVLNEYEARKGAARGKFSAKVLTDEHLIRVYNDFAIVIAKVTATLTIEGRTFNPTSLRMTAVCRNEKGEWKVVSTQFTKIVSPDELLSEPPPPAPKPQ